MDTFLGQRFRDAGFVTIGKTNTPELGILPTTEPRAYGPSRNPWDTERTTGGSSGGSAAAVSSGMVPIAHANDGGGSIRIPASCCGLFGLKPTRQRISRGAPGRRRDLGPHGRARGHALGARRRAAARRGRGPAPGDPYVAPRRRAPTSTELERRRGPLRIGFLEHPPVPGLESDPECVAAVAQTVGLLESLGHRVEDSSPIDPGLAEALDLEDTFLTRWAAGQAASLDQSRSCSGARSRRREVEPLTWALAEIGRERSSGRYLRDVAIHQTVARAIAAWFEGGFDLLLTPTMSEPPVPLGTYDDSGPDPMAAFRRAVPPGPSPRSSTPPASRRPRCRCTGPRPGLPIGVQLVAPLGREDLLIRVAAQLERAPLGGPPAPVFAGRRDT